MRALKTHQLKQNQVRSNCPAAPPDANRRQPLDCTAADLLSGTVRAGSVPARACRARWCACAAGGKAVQRVRRGRCGEAVEAGRARRAGGVVCRLGRAGVRCAAGGLRCSAPRRADQKAVAARLVRGVAAVVWKRRQRKDTECVVGGVHEAPGRVRAEAARPNLFGFSIW